jgi:high-affinity Fe2+/Pb2+ permease
MLEKEEAFLAHWSAHREAERKSIKPLLMGLSGGILVGLAVWIMLYSGWYARATMQAGGKLNFSLLFVAIALFSGFGGYFYRQYRWEMREQQYQELLAKKQRSKPMQPIAP